MSLSQGIQFLRSGRTRTTTVILLAAAMLVACGAESADVKLQAHPWSCVREDGGDNGVISYFPSGVAQIQTYTSAGARTFRTYRYLASGDQIIYTWDEAGGGTATVEIEVLTDTLLSTHLISGEAAGNSQIDFTTVGPIGATRTRCTPTSE
jgi:hypothetical protein